MSRFPAQYMKSQLANRTEAVLQGQRISLRPMLLSERRKFFRWATHSDATDWWYGERYGDEIPGYEGFKLDWSEAYFDLQKPEHGQCFIILFQGEEVGQINYNPINRADRATEMDILIADKKNYGKGIGSGAIRLLCNYLFEVLNVSRVRIEVLRQNERAFYSYQKGGFRWTYTYILNGIEWRVMELIA